jgi:GT2 family glycosyltransferase
MDGLTVLTLTRDRNRHLSNLVKGLERSELAPAELVVAWMGGEDPRETIGDPPFAVLIVAVGGEDLPLGVARNRAVTAAGSERIVFLDVDCVPASGLLGSYAAELLRAELLMGPVRYLPEGGPCEDDDRMSAVATAAPGRERIFAGPAPRQCRHEDFWSTNFALTRDCFERVGGFDEAYTGYGIEDTDFGQRARQAGVPVTIVPRAIAFHQHHASTPFSDHNLPSLIRNSHRYHAKWGEWPAPGWLARLAREGRVRWEPGDGVLEAVPASAER